MQGNSCFNMLLAVLLVLFVTGQGLASGFVLCVGADGHSAYEQAFAGKCAPVEPACPAQEECSCSACAEDRCGPCQDISTSLDSLHGRARGQQDFSVPLPLPSLPAVIVSTSPVFVRDLTANLSSQPPPRPYTELISLRTVVLLN